jgi:hypothetical protein
MWTLQEESLRWNSLSSPTLNPYKSTACSCHGSSARFMLWSHGERVISWSSSLRSAGLTDHGALNYHHAISATRDVSGPSISHRSYPLDHRSFSLYNQHIAPGELQILECSTGDKAGVSRTHPSCPREGNRWVILPSSITLTFPKVSDTDVWSYEGKR